MPLHTKRMRTGQFIVWFLMFASWVIMLAGMGRVQNVCNDGGLNPDTEDFQKLKPDTRSARNYVREGHMLSFGLPWNLVPGADGTGDGRDDRCGVLFSLDWWYVMYQFFLVLFSVICIVNEKAHSLKYALVVFYAIGIFQSTVFTSIYVKYSYAFSGGDHSSDAVGQGASVAVAGGIAITILNYVFLTLFGASEQTFPDPEPPAQSEVKVDM